MKRIPAACLLLLCALPAFAAEKPLPTPADIEADMKAQKYNDAIQKLGRVLSASKTEQASYDLYKLQMSRGEAHMNLKNSASAKAAYADAERAAKSKADAAQAAGMRLLIQHGENWCYRSKAFDALKGKDPGKNVDPVKPISYVDPATRPLAMTALEVDQIADAKQTLKKIKGSQALTPIPPFARTLTDLRKLEYAVNSTEAETAQIISDLTSHADHAMQSALENMSKTVQQIQASANKLTTQTMQETDPRTKRPVNVIYEKKNGLSNNDRNVLNDMIATCNKLGPMCRELTASLGVPDSTFAASVRKAGSISQSATGTLRADYGNWTRKQ